LQLLPSSSGVASPKIWGAKCLILGEYTILFTKTLLKAQNDYFLKIFGGMYPLSPPGYADAKLYNHFD